MKKSILTFVLLAICGLAFAQLQVAPQWTSVLSNQPETFRTQLISSSERSIQVNVQVPGFYTTNVTTPRGEAKIISMPKAVSTAKAGEPNVPMTGIPAIIGDHARMNVRVLNAQYMDFEGIEVAPSKGDFPRTIDPATVPYTYGVCYSQDAFFPANNVDLYEPYIVRDFRGQNMVVYPYAYNPVTKTLRVYYDMTIEMYKVDDNGSNAFETRRDNTVKMDSDFKSMYQRHFINYEATMNRYTPVDEEGDLLIICYDSFISSMTDFVNWKKTRGVNTTIVGTSTAGSTYSAIKNYIQSQYNANNNLTHVLLVGDVAQIPGYTFYSNYKGDNPYGQIVGNDIYNDVFIGRFSAQNTTQVTTQVQKIIKYERDLTTSDSWCNKGLGVSASAGNSGHYSEDDYQHIENLRTDLMNYGYSTVYQDYYSVSGYPSSSTSTISNHINSGVGIINYCNHGSETSWSSHNYSNSHVNALTNNNMLPFIFSVACVNGKYDYSSGDCFAEAWMHATNNSTGAPTGAVGTLMSYINQPWIPPMWAQDEFVDILIESYSNNKKYTWGGAAVNGMMAIFDHYSATSGSDAYNTYQAWILFGDPTLTLRTKTPQAMTVTHSGTLPMGLNTYNISVNNGNGAVATITDANHNILGKATVSNGSANITISGTLTVNQELTLCVFGYNKVTYLGTITVVGGTQYDIAATASPTEGGTVSGAGTYYEDTECTLTATPNQYYTFTNWKKGNTVVSTEASYTFTVSSSTAGSYTATFTAIPQYTISASANPTNGGTVRGGGTYYENTQCTLTATANTHYEFANWKKGNSVVSTDPAYTFTVTGAGSYVANFTALAPHSVTCNSVQNGTISANVTTAYKNEIVTLSATPASGYCFSAWDVRDASNNSIPVTDDKFTMPDSDVTVSATFVIGYNVTLATPMNGTISADPMGGPQGTTINLTATPALGYVFSSWVVYKTGDLNTIVTVNNNSFNLPAYDVTVVGIFTEPEGGDVTIGSGTTTNSGNYVPTSVNYEYSLTQQIYTADELGDAASIIAISFYYNSANASDARNLQVYMSHTSNSTLTGWTTVSSSQLVFAGTHTFTQGWNTLTLTTPFAYNGTSNVLVTVDDNSGTYSANGYFRTYSTGANRALYYRNANTNPDPTGSVSVTAYKIKYNAQMTVTKAIPSTEGYLSVSPSSLTGFEAIGGGSASESQSIAIIGANLQDNVTVTPPTGYEVSTTLSGSYANTLTLTSSDGSLMQMVYVRLASNLNAGDYNGDMTIVSGASSTTVSLSGTVAQGGPQYTITVTANPTEGGTVSGSGTYYENNSCTIAATASEGYTFTNWTKDGTEVSTDATYTFNVTEDAEYVANFTLNTYMVTVSVNPAGAGTITGDGTYNHGALATLTATAASRYVFVNWTKNGTEVSTNATYSFTVTEDVALEANFEIPTVESTVQLNSGWTWWSGNQEITLAQLEAAMGTSGLYIVSQTGDMASYYEGMGWDDGELAGIDLSRMYKISASAPVELVLNAPAADPSEYTITLNNGANWIGYPVQQSMDINEALADLTPASNDVIKSLNSFAMYSAGRWRGGLNTLEPGKGYVYTSKATGQKTFVYPSQSRSNAMLKKNIVPEDNVWVPVRSEFRDNMSVVAKVSFADMTTMDEETEVVAFVGDECRGSAKLMYMEDTGEYVAFLLVYGQDGELVSFKVYNDGETMDAAETVEMRSDAVVGDLDAPYALHSVGTMSLFPNPVSAGESVRMEMPANVELAGARVEVYNALGALLVNETLTNGDAEFRAMPVSGVYTVRVTDRKGNVHFGKLIVR